jgi:Phage capsid protein
MSINVTPAMQVKYKNNVEMILQQQSCQLEVAVTVQDDASAEKVKIKDLVGNTLPNEADERHGDTKYNNPTYDGVWIPKSNELYYADLIDNADKLGTSIELQGTSVMSGAGTINRAKDRRILEGFYGSIISGKEGTVSTPFPAGQVIAVTEGGAAGAQKINVAKLIAADKLLAQNYVDPMLEKWMVLTADDNAQLLTEVPATSSDFKASYAGKVMKSKLQTLLGWRFIHMELDNPMLGTIPALATDGSGYRKTPFWVKPGIVANFWQRSRTMIDPLPQKLGSVQVFAGTTLSATRTQAGMAGVILNSKG